MILDELRADLVTRWKAAFERRPAVKAGAPEAAQTVYTRYPAYALSGWSNGKLKPEARVSRTPGTDGRDFVFLLDAAGRPLHVGRRCFDGYSFGVVPRGAPQTESTTISFASTA